MGNLLDHKSAWLEDGDHVVSVDEFEADTIEKTGTQVLRVYLRATNGRRVKKDFFITEKALWAFADFASACGLDDDTLAQCPDTLQGVKRLAHERLRGAVVNVRVGRDDREGKYAEVKQFWSANGAPPSEQPPEPITANANGEDDDIPF